MARLLKKESRRPGFFTGSSTWRGHQIAMCKSPREMVSIRRRIFCGVAWICLQGRAVATPFSSWPARSRLPRRRILATFSTRKGFWREKCSTAHRSESYRFCSQVRAASPACRNERVLAHHGPAARTETAGPPMSSERLTFSDRAGWKIP